MRLTQQIRDGIAYRIMADIPEINYQGQMRARAERMGVEAPPDKVRAIWLDTSLRHHVTVNRFYVCCMTLQAPGLDRDSGDTILKNDPELSEAHRLHDEQRERRREIGKQIKANVNSCTTRKQFVERFPELAKYAPVEATTAANLPATTSFIDGLKAAGLKVEAA